MTTPESPMKKRPTALRPIEAFAAPLVTVSTKVTSKITVLVIVVIGELPAAAVESTEDKASELLATTEPWLIDGV